MFHNCSDCVNYIKVTSSFYRIPAAWTGSPNTGILGDYTERFARYVRRGDKYLDAAINTRAYLISKGASDTSTVFDNILFGRVNTELFRTIVHNTGDDLYKVNYSVYLNDFDMGCGYCVKVENDKVKSIIPYGDMSVIENKSIEEIIVTNEMEEEALTKAAEAINSRFEISEQTIQKMVRKGIPYLHVNTYYNSGDVFGEGVSSYNYKIN